MEELGIDTEKVKNCLDESFTKEDHSGEPDYNCKLGLEKKALEEFVAPTEYPFVIINKQPCRVYIYIVFIFREY